MSRTVTQEERYRMMTEKPISRLIPGLAVPTIISMLITSIYNMADTFFVSQINTSASAAVGIIFSLMAMIQAVGFTLGMGAGNYISRSLGAKNEDIAVRTAATAFFTAIGIGVVMAVTGLSFLDRLVRLLGATETIAPYARDYVRCLMPGTPFLICSFVLNNQLRFQGSAFYGMIGITAGTILNIILDPVFIFVLDMQVAGAAIATAIGQAVSFAVLLFMTSRAGNIPIKPRRFCLNAETAKEIFRGGVPSLARQGLTSLATICLNVAAGGFGDAAVAAMSIVSRIMQICNSAIIGFGQGFQPVCGFNFGAGLYRRVRDAFWFCVRLSAIVLCVVAIVAMIFAPQIVGLFIKDNPDVREIGAAALRMQCVTMPLFSFVIMANMMLQTIGYAGRATLLAAARQGLFLIPAVFLLSHFFGLTGLELSQAVSDLLSFLLSVPVTLTVLRQFQQSK